MSLKWIKSLYSSTPCTHLLVLAAVTVGKIERDAFVVISFVTQKRTACHRTSQSVNDLCVSL